MKYIENYIYEDDYIGRGTFSKVYIGYIKDKPDIKYAIKKIYRKSDPKYVKYLNLEIEIMGKLDHTNIIKMHDTIYTDKYVFLILELCDTDLYSYIQITTLTEEDTKFIIRQIVDAIKYIMDNNIVHRDLKPHNILINETTKEIKLCDFGFAREFKDTLLSDTVCGSPLYMAPELLQNHKYNIKSDVWSLGIIMYEIVMKNHPFKSSNISDLISKINNNKPILSNSTFSIECKDLIISLLEVDYTKRLDWNDVFTNKWIYNKIEHTYDNILENNLNTIPELDSSNEEMYFDDIYNYSMDFEIENDIENDIENGNIENDIEKMEKEIENMETKIGHENEIIKTMNTPMSKPINIKKNVENDYIFVNKPAKSVINTLMDNSNEIIQNLKKYI
jgi:serine/threonine-protein kinase ULK2